jgi:hypothetical protein
MMIKMNGVLRRNFDGGPELPNGTQIMQAALFVLPVP